MGRIVRSPQAESDVYEIAMFIARDNMRAALELVDDFDKALCLLSDFPGIGRLRDDLQPGLRSYPVGKNYLLFYTAIEGGIELVRVLHGMRDLTKRFPAR